MWVAIDVFDKTACIMGNHDCIDKNYLIQYSHSLSFSFGTGAPMMQCVVKNIYYPWQFAARFLETWICRCLDDFPLVK